MLRQTVNFKRSRKGGGIKNSWEEVRNLKINFLLSL